MHLPDGFLSPPVWIATDLLAVATLAACVRRLKRTLPDEIVPRMGMLGAFVFAAQLVNVPVAAGTSGHLLGGVLVGSLVGPEAATLVMASVFFIQCLLFQDGGILALGANIVNMGVVGGFVGYYVSVELGLSGTVPLTPSLFAMVGVHALIGLVEGGITVAVVRFVERVRPETLEGTALQREAA